MMIEKKCIAIWLRLAGAIMASGLYWTSSWQASANEPQSGLYCAKAWQSQLVTVAADGSDRKVIIQVDALIEAPNWSPDSKSLVYNLKTGPRRITATGGTPRELEIGLARMSNDRFPPPDRSQAPLK